MFCVRKIAAVHAVQMYSDSHIWIPEAKSERRPSPGPTRLVIPHSYHFVLRDTYDVQRLLVSFSAGEMEPFIKECQLLWNQPS